MHDIIHNELVFGKVTSLFGCYKTRKFELVFSIRYNNMEVEYLIDILFYFGYLGIWQIVMHVCQITGYC